MQPKLLGLTQVLWKSFIPFLRLQDLIRTAAPMTGHWKSCYLQVPLYFSFKVRNTGGQLVSVDCNSTQGQTQLGSTQVEVSYTYSPFSLDNHKHCSTNKQAKLSKRFLLWIIRGSSTGISNSLLITFLLLLSVWEFQCDFSWILELLGLPVPNTRYVLKKITWL